ncbi:MAG: hypothetical protein N2444_08855, partial [Methylocystis sp.]|nr:hypothetical protein [Methylocystis sp.]
MTKWVYSFSAGKAEGAASMKELLGGKGANLAEMAALGLPVPPGFTITTEVCAFFYARNRTFPADLAAQVDAALDEIGNQIDLGTLTIPVQGVKQKDGKITAQGLEVRRMEGEEGGG